MHKYVKTEGEDDDMPQIVPIKDLRDTNKFSELVQASREPIFVTKNGYGSMVVMSMETYNAKMNTRPVDDAILEAEAEMRNGGQTVEAKKAMTALRRKYFEKV